MMQRSSDPAVEPDPRDQRPNWLLHYVLRAAAPWTLNLGALWLIVWILGRTGISLAPLILGLFVAYLLLPIVNHLDRFMPRWSSILVVYAVGF